MVRRELARHVAPGARLTLALSGGVDSITLLDVLARLAPEHPFALGCIHVDHGISPSAGAWARFARAASRRYGVRCHVRKADLAPHHALGREGAARAARYELFGRAAGDFLVLAQHADDQAETVLLQLARGAGLAGLAGMPTVRAQRTARRSPQLLRPLLGVARGDIERYACDRGLQWVEDESNLDTALARNAVRHRVLPLLREINPAAVANLARSARLLAEANELAEALGASDVAAASPGGRLDVASLAALGPARARNALRWAIAEAGLGVPDAARLDELLAQLVHARRDAAVRLALNGGEVRRFRGAAWILPTVAPVPRRMRLVWPGRNRWPVHDLHGVLTFQRTVGKGLALAALRGGPVELCVRTGGERLRPDPARPRRELKALLREAGLPPWERERLPLLYCGGMLAWVPGIGIEASLRAGPREPGLEPDWRPTPAAVR